MESNQDPTTTKYQPVTVDVPEDRIAEFHAFFARFLAARSGGGPRGRHGRHHRAEHGRRCSGRRAGTESEQATGEPTEIAQV
jgi:hypothetical protein